MKLKKVDKPIERANGKPNKLLAILDEFISSDYGFAEVIPEEGDCHNVYNLTSELKQAIKYFRYNGIKARTIHGKCYLIRKEGNNND